MESPHVEQRRITRCQCGAARRCWMAVAGLLIVVFAGGTAVDAADWNKNLLRMPAMKTMGGRQFWGDVRFLQGWRIQQNVLSKHYRLLDADDCRHASGTFEECNIALDKIAVDQKLPAMKGKAVILVHGILRSSKCFSELSKDLTSAGYLVVPFDYPSTQVQVAESSEYLRKVVESLQGVDEISFVVHSMGGLVVRAYLSKEPDPRIGKMVMLGVPNLGAEMADLFKRNPLFRLVFGPAGKQLAMAANYAKDLPTPAFPFGVIAGVRGKPNGYNPLIPGEDDGTVTLASTRLPGAADFATVKCLHSFISSNPQAIKYVMNFLKNAQFRTDGPAEPIPPVEKDTTADEKPATAESPAVAETPPTRT